MRDLPPASVRVSRLFEPVFSERGWDWARVLRVGASVAPGQRTVAAILQVLGLSEERQFQTYPRVLKRAHWSSREVSRRLLGALVRVFVAADAPVVVELDEQFCGVSARRCATPPNEGTGYRGQVTGDGQEPPTAGTALTPQPPLPQAGEGEQG